MTVQEKARDLRYKRGALASIGYDLMMEEFNEIEEACSDVHWYFDEDGDNILSAMDGDEDEVYEFKMAFSDLETKCEMLRYQINEQWNIGEYFDDCIVGLIGNRYDVVGFDTYEEDYYSLCRYEGDLAVSESAKRIMRWTKQEMICNIGQCMGIAFAFLDLRQAYDYLKATLDILRGENMSVLKVVKEIERLYDNAMEDGYSKEFEKLIATLPDRNWIE